MNNRLHHTPTYDHSIIKLFNRNADNNYYYFLFLGYNNSILTHLAIHNYNRSYYIQVESH